MVPSGTAAVGGRRSVSESGLGAADVPEEASGTWRLDRDSIVLSEAAPGGVPRVLPIASADQQRLVIRK